MTVHTSADSGEASSKNQPVSPSFQHGDSGFTEEEEEYDDDTEFVKLYVSGFSRRALEPHTTLFDVWIAGYWPVSDFWLVLKAWLGILAEFLGSFYADHVRFDLRHPYIIIPSSDALTHRTRLYSSSYLLL